MIYKVGIKRFSDVVYQDEVCMINNDYWTTVEAENERQAKLLAQKNILVKIAMTEWFIRNVKMWKHIFMDLSDMVIERVE